MAELYRLPTKTGKPPSLEEIIENPIRFGKAVFEFASVNQWLLVFAPEPDIVAVGGFGSAKTMGGIGRATRLSCWYPGNKGIIGRFASTDLAATTQADAKKFWEDANLLDDFVDKGKYKVPTATLRCIDPMSNEILKGKYSEVLFLHMDNPSHIHGHHVGWGWIDEAHEVAQESRDKLASRIRLKGYEHVYSLWETSNPNGHDRLYEFCFDPEVMARLREKKPEAAKSRRGIISPTYENRFLPKENIRRMEDTYSEKKRRVFLEASFESFEGQVFEEWNEAIHVLSIAECFPNGIPETWDRYLALDVGGSDPWAWEWAAVDPWGNVVFYDEINEPGALIEPFVKKAKPRIPEHLKFKAKVIDYENKAVAAELADRGIVFSNAKKQNKNDSIFRLGGYLHANPKNPFPAWHPWKNTMGPGDTGAPHLFVGDRCKGLIKQTPAARWRKKRGSETFENELDPDNGHDDALHAALYLIRERPKPTELETNAMDGIAEELDKMSKILHFEKKVRKEEEQRQQWNIHMGHGRTRKRSAFGIPLNLLRRVQ